MPATTNLRAHCKHTQKLSFVIRLDPAGRKWVILTFRCEECGAMREFVGHHVEVTNEESTMSASVAEHSGWHIPQ
jgi:hypothetical protein